MSAPRAVVANNIELALKGLVSEAIQGAFPGLKQFPEPLVIPGKFSDFQCDNAMGLVKLLKTHTPPMSLPPPEVAKKLVEALPANDLVGKTEVTDRGFITIEVSSDWLAKTMTRTSETGVLAPALAKQKVLVDFSSPNIAKDMHVGHLRSTIIGECLCRVLEFVGHDVRRINHVGDWGTQFGMLILYLKQQHPDFLTSPPPIKDLVVFYKAAKVKFDEDQEFKEAARLEVVKLQAHEPEATKAWTQICDLSRKEFQEVYDTLKITLEERGESFYNPMIPDVLEKLRVANQIEPSDGAEIILSKAVKPLKDMDAKGLARLLAYFVSSKRDGTVVFSPVLLDALKAAGVAADGAEGQTVLKLGKESRPVDKFDTRTDMEKLGKAAIKLFAPKPEATIAAELEKLGLLLENGTMIREPRFSFPLMARKSDGGYTYDTTDLAASFHRFQVEKYNRVVYVTDRGQFEHFKMVIQTAEDMGWMGEGHRWAHAGFGLVTGEDGKKIKTRSGDSAKLKDLLLEAVDRSYENLVVREKEQPQGFTEEEMKELSRKIGLGAVKYFDLKQNRTTDYKFSYDKMLDFNGNTAVFLLYSYARICSIKRKAGKELADIQNTPIQLVKEKERKLALACLKFEPMVLKTVEDLFPHNITDFCYELVGRFNDFYNECKVIGDELQDSRLLLIEVVGATLKRSLDLLGIEVAQRL